MSIRPHVAVLCGAVSARLRVGAPMRFEMARYAQPMRNARDTLCRDVFASLTLQMIVA
jgi:hypothetical protein